MSPKEPQTEIKVAWLPDLASKATSVLSDEVSRKFYAVLGPQTKRYVLGFAFGSIGDLALIRKGYPDWQAGKLNGIGGKIELGEDALQAMIREFTEETRGLVITDWVLCAYLVGPSASYIVHCFAANFGGDIYSALTAKGRWGSPLPVGPEKPVVVNMNELWWHKETVPNVPALVEIARLSLTDKAVDLVVFYEKS